MSLAVLLSFCMVLLEGVRESTLRLEAECVMDIGLNSILAEYHKELFRQYNLFYIDTSYKSSKPSTSNTQDHLMFYLNQNFSQEALGSQWFYKDFMSLTASEATITAYATAVDQKGENLRRQAIEAVKQDIGITYLQELLDRFNTVKEYGLDTGDAQKQKEEIDQTLESYDQTQVQIDEDEWEEVVIDNPTGMMDQKRASGVLTWVIDDESKISAKVADLSNLASKRAEQELLHEGNMAMADESGLFDKFLFVEYLMRFTGNYLTSDEDHFLEYQHEYLICGKSAEVDNLKSVVNRISVIREVANALYLFTNQEKSSQAELVAMALSSVIFIPELEPLFQASILLAWAYAESLYDVEMLLKGEKVPLFKSNDTWHYGINVIFGEEQENSSPIILGLDYEDYLRILMWLTSEDTLTYRLMDLIEMDMRSTQGNEAFCMDACIDRLEAQVCVQSSYGYTYTIRRKKRYGA
jgi:hypothetical protein